MPASPSAQKMMAEKGIDAASVEGSGKRGQILKEDVMKAGSAPKPAPVAARRKHGHHHPGMMKCAKNG